MLISENTPDVDHVARTSSTSFVLKFPHDGGGSTGVRHLNPLIGPLELLS